MIASCRQSSQPTRHRHEHTLLAAAITDTNPGGQKAWPGPLDQVVWKSCLVSKATLLHSHPVEGLPVWDCSDPCEPMVNRRIGKRIRGQTKPAGGQVFSFGLYRPQPVRRYKEGALRLSAIYAILGWAR